MNAVLNIVQSFPRYLWTGWGAIASLFLFLAVWDLGNQLNGSLILPSPQETFIALWSMLHTVDIWQDVAITVERSLWGFVISVLLGGLLGILAGSFATASMMSRPIITVMMGVPPIAWIILALLWFGVSDGSIIFTLVVASFPIVFVGALQGTRTLEGDLNDMSNSFKTPFFMRLTDVYFPHVFSYLFPASISALGMSWKVVIMSELLASTPTGIGASLAVARSHFDSAVAMALVLIMVIFLLLIEYVLLEPIKREVEQWRN